MQNETQTGTIDCTPTWESLVDEMMQKLEENQIPWNARQIIKENFRKMAQVADMYVAHLKKSEKKETDDLMKQIVKIATPKFCGDTSIILGAKVKITGFTGEDADLNGLTGLTRHPFCKGYNSTGMVGVWLYMGQKTPARIENNEINVDADKIMFIE
jgi:hypothetical protein